METEQFSTEWKKKEIKKEIKGFLEFNENEVIIYPKLCDTVIKVKLIAINASVNKL